MASNAPRIGLALGGGGIAGYSFHAGALGAIHEMTGWDPRTAEVILGTSAGSSVAAVLRGNVAVTELVERILSVPTDAAGMDRLRRVAGRGQALIGSWWCGPSSLGLIGNELRRGHRLRKIRILAGALPSGRIDNSVLSEQAAELHRYVWPERHLWVPAVDLARGELTVFGRDTTDVDVGTAVAASCAIPGFFQPVEINGRRFVDGGVRSLVNVDLLAELDLDLVVTLSPMSLDSFDARLPVSSLIRGFPKWQLRNEIKALRDAGIQTLTLEPDRSVHRSMGLNPMDPTRMVPVLMDSAASMTAELTRKELSDAVALLRAAGKAFVSPVDVPYPD